MRTTIERSSETAVWRGRRATRRGRFAKYAAATVLALSLVPLSACSSGTTDSSSPASESGMYTITFDQGDVDSPYGVQNWDAVESLDALGGDTVEIPDYSGADYGVFVPGYQLTGWERSDTGEVVEIQTVEEAAEQQGSDEAASDSASSSDEKATSAKAESSSSKESSQKEGSDEGSHSSKGTSGSDEFTSPILMTMPDQDITLTAQWEPMTVEVYVQQGADGAAEIAGTVELTDSNLVGSVSDTADWQSYNTFNQGEARVFTAAFAYPLESIFEKADVAVDPDDTVVIGQTFVSNPYAGDSASVSHPWSYYTGGQFYPDTTCNTYDSSNAVAVTPSLAVSYKEGRSSSKDELLGAVAEKNDAEGIAGQSADMTPRALFGVPLDQYDQNDNYRGSEHPYSVNQILIIKAA